MSEGIMEDVRTIGSGVRSISSYAGLNDKTYMLVTKSIISGACIFNEANLDLKGNVVSRRAESLYIGNALNTSRKALASDDPMVICNRILPQRKLDELTRMNCYDSVVLIPLMRRLQGVKPDYQADRMLRYGEQVIAHFKSVPVYTPRDGPFSVDMRKLESTKVSVELKRMFRELKTLEEIAYQL